MATSLPTTDEIVAVGRAAFRSAIDPSGTGAVNLAAGSRNDTAISALAAIANRLALYSLDRASAARIASATGDDLDEAALDLYGEKRKEAAAATGFIQLERPGTGATSIPLGSRFGIPASGTQPVITFQSTEDISVASAELTVEVPVECTDTGTAANGATPALVTAILDALPDATWVLDTAYDAVCGGGAFRETDDDFKARLSLTTPQAERQRGTKAAIDTGALRVPGTAFVTSIEPLDGTVVMYSGDSAFQLSEAMKQAIDQELLEWRCFGVPVVQRSYNVQTVTVAATVYMAQSLANYDQVTITQDAVQRVKEYFENRPRPEDMYRDAVIAAIFKAHPEIQHVTLSSPSADITRPADSGYGTVTALARYRADESSISISVSGPLTT
jgi:uncharacterized phage protein gp47/JayE